VKKIRCPCGGIESVVKRFLGLLAKITMLPEELELGIVYGEEVRAEDE